jgi:hypothetical protein
MGMDDMIRRSNLIEPAPRLRGEHRPPHDACLYFNVADARVVAPHIAAYVGVLTFTIEMWIRSNTGTKDATMANLLNKGDRGASGSPSQWNLSFSPCADGLTPTADRTGWLETNWYYSGAWRAVRSGYRVVNPLIWTHVAVTVMGTSPYTHTLYADGNVVAIGTDAGTFATNTEVVKIGSQFLTGFGYLNDYYGFMSDVRVWNTVRTPDQIKQNMYSALTGNEPDLLAYWPFNDGTGNVAIDLTANANHARISGANWSTIQPAINDPNVVLLVQSETTNESTVFEDTGVGPNCPHTITPQDNAQHSTAQAKFGSSSMSFDGNGDYLSVADPDDNFHFGTGDFTVDFWAYNLANGAGYGSPNVVQLGGTNYGGTIGHLNGGLMKVYLSAGGSSWNLISGLSMGNLPGTNWVHYAFVRSGDIFYTFRNGTVVATATATGSVYQPSADLTIMRYYHATYGPSYYSGYIEELRISKVARWTESFTPPTAPYNV